MEESKMKRYTLEVIIDEGYDEWWEEISNNNLSGCDEIRKAVRDALFDVGFQTNCKVNLVKYESESNE